MSFNNVLLNALKSVDDLKKSFEEDVDNIFLSEGQRDYEEEEEEDEEGNSNLFDKLFSFLK